MSDEAGGGETSAPIDSAAPVAAGDAAPVEKAPAKQRTIDDDLEDVLKKHGGYKYKAGGKEKAVTASADLKRLLSRVDGTEAAASVAMKEKQEADTIKSRVAQLEKMRPNERIKALADLGINPKALREAVEEEILAEDERAKSQQHLSPRERELQAELDVHKREKAEYEERRAAWMREQEENEEVAKSSALYDKISTVAAKALQKAKIAGTHAPRFLNSIAAEIDRAESLGLEYDENDLAETVVKEHGSLARDYYSGLDVAAHIEDLRAMEMPDPADPTKTTNRFRLMMLAEAAAIRAKHSNGTPMPVNGATSVARPPTAQQRELSREEKIAAARTFGGERTW